MRPRTECQLENGRSRRLWTPNGHHNFPSSVRYCLQAVSEIALFLPSEVDADFVDLSVPVLRTIEAGPERLLVQLTSRVIGMIPALHASFQEVLDGGSFDGAIVGSMFYGALPTMIHCDAGRTKGADATVWLAVMDVWPRV